MGGPHPKDYRDTIHLLRRGSAVPKDNNTEVPPPKEVANPVPSLWGTIGPKPPNLVSRRQRRCNRIFIGTI